MAGPDPVARPGMGDELLESKSFTYNALGNRRRSTPVDRLPLCALAGASDTRRMLVACRLHFGVLQPAT